MPPKKKQKQKQLLPWALPEGFAVSAKPDTAMLEPNNPEGKKLVGRSVLFHWADVGWCSGVIEKVNDDNTIGGDMINFEIYNEMDDTISRHLLELEEYIPDGPPDSWVLLEQAEVTAVAQARRTSTWARNTHRTHISCTFAPAWAAPTSAPRSDPARRRGMRLPLPIPPLPLHRLCAGAIK